MFVFRSHHLRSCFTAALCLVALPIVCGCSRARDDQAKAPTATSADRQAANEQTFSPPSIEIAKAKDIPRIESLPVDNAAASAQQPPGALRSVQTIEPLNRESLPRIATVESIAPVAEQTGDHLSHLPAGAQRGDQGFATVQVFYATDRQRDALSLADYELSGQKQLFIMACFVTLVLAFVAAVGWYLGRRNLGIAAGLMGCMAGIAAGGLLTAGRANIEKHGVTYNGDRGSLVRGVCEVTVPDTHQRGMVERPSFLHFTVSEDQQDHIVLTSAIELSKTDFQNRLTESVNSSPDRDLLVFVHGYNVDFPSAVRRTAQVAVDLPFEGVPICYTWPSQGSLLGYSVDETNAEWTIAHLKQFLLELSIESGARSINVVAHSMGNRPMVAAMQQISWQLAPESAAPFDRIVLAAPDVDADRFRRDFAPSLLQVAQQVTLYASSDDQALIVSKQVHGYPRAGESGANIVVVPGIETVDVSGIDLSLLGHSYYGDNESMLRDLYEVVRARLPAPNRALLIPRGIGQQAYWQLAQRPTPTPVR